MEILVQDLRYALRSLRRSPGFTAVVVAVLGLGVGVNSMIFCMGYGIMFRPWPMPQCDRVMTINETNKVQGEKSNDVSWLNFHDLRHELKSFEAIGGFWQIGGQVTIGNEPERLAGAERTSGLMPGPGSQPQLW